MSLVLDPTHLLYPRELESADVSDKIRRCLAQSDEPMLKGELETKTGLANFIQRECKQKDLHPLWPLITLQKEQGLLRDDGKLASMSSWAHAAGVVGQHTKGTANSTWDGLFQQLALCIRLYAWHGGTRASDFAFGIFPGDRPPMDRWRPADTQKAVQLLKLGVKDGKEVALNDRIFPCRNAAEYAMWIFTPNGQEDVLGINAAIAEKQVLPFFQ